MGRHERSLAQNPYINRHGGRTRYMPNRAKDPTRKKPTTWQHKGTIGIGSLRGSGRNADRATPRTLTEAEAAKAALRERQRQERDGREQGQRRFYRTLPKLIQVIGVAPIAKGFRGRRRGA